MEFQVFLKFLTMAYLIWVGTWFATAQAKFSRSSKAKPMLFMMVGCSLLATVATFLATMSTPVPLVRVVITLAMNSLCVILIKWAFRSIRQRNLGLAFSGIVPDEIVQHGPYRYVRHPLYLAYSIFWVACIVFSASVLVAIPSVGVIILYILAARAEERDLMSSSLSDGYKSYRQRTGLIVPSLFSRSRNR